MHAAFRSELCPLVGASSVETAEKEAETQGAVHNALILIAFQALNGAVYLRSYSSYCIVLLVLMAYERTIK